MFGIGRGGQHGVVAVRVEAKDHLGAGWFFEAQPLRADGHAAIGTDPERGCAHSTHSPTKGSVARAAAPNGFLSWPGSRPVAASGAVRDGLPAHCDAPAGQLAVSISKIFSLAK